MIEINLNRVKLYKNDDKHLHNMRINVCMFYKFFT